MHGWVLQRVRKGNERDEAQTIPEIIEFLENEEEKKMHKSIARFFAISKNLDDPRIGLKNAQTIQNQLVRMACYDQKSKCVVLTSMACCCETCIVGDFKACKNHAHEVMNAKISESRSGKLTKLETKNKLEYLKEENDFNKNLNVWNLQWANQNAENKSMNDEQTTSDAQINDDDAVIINDDPEFWVREIEFNEHLRTVYNSYKETAEYQTFLQSAETLDKIDLTSLNEVFDCINEDTSNASNFDLGFTQNLPIKRGDLQRCIGRRWFNNDMINLAFKSLQIHNKKVIYLRCEVIEEIKVMFQKSNK